MTVRDGARGLAVLDWTLRLVEANSAARRECAAWSDGFKGTRTRSVRPWCLPPVLGDACRTLQREWESLLRSNPNAVVLRRHPSISHPRVPDLTVSITMVCRDASGLSEPSFVVEFDRRVESEPADMASRSINVLQMMTAAEREVALSLMSGLSNQEIADRIAKSVHAVKFLLHRIYQKTGIPNRAALVAALGARYHS